MSNLRSGHVIIIRYCQAKLDHIRSCQVKSGRSSYDSLERLNKVGNVRLVD